MISVNKKTEQEFTVTVRDNNSQTEHAVTLDDDYYQKLTNGKIPGETLIEKSFEFLLKRESKESILKRFNLKIISKYFPEYESKIKNI